MHQFVNANMCNFAIFGPIFIKLSPKNVEMLFNIWEVLAHIWIGKGPYLAQENPLEHMKPAACMAKVQKFYKCILKG